MDNEKQPKPTTPFSFLIDDGKAKTVIETLTEPESELTLKLIALLNAKGVGFHLIKELVPESAGAIETVSQSPKFTKLINSFTAKLSISTEDRINRASSIALDRILDILNNPKSVTKEVLTAARDLLDRSLGKATQKIDLGVTNNNGDDYRTITSAINAASERLRLIEEKREAVRLSILASKQPQIQTIDV